MMDLKLPRLETLEGTEGGRGEERLARELKSYLYQLTEQLRYAMANLDLDENFSAPSTERLRSVETHAIDAKAAAEELMATSATKSELAESILLSAETVTQSYETAIAMSEERMSSTMAQIYTAQDETASLEQRLTSLAQQTAKDIEFNFSKVNEYTVEVDGELKSFIETVAHYLRFSAEGIELGEINNPFVARLTNTRLSFLQDGTEIAYISNNKMYITDAEIIGKLTMGSTALGFFDWTPRANGNLSLKWREG